MAILIDTSRAALPPFPTMKSNALPMRGGHDDTPTKTTRVGFLGKGRQKANGTRESIQSRESCVGF
jgi:hypothetical protein